MTAISRNEVFKTLILTDPNCSLLIKSVSEKALFPKCHFTKYFEFVNKESKLLIRAIFHQEKDCGVGFNED